MRRAFIQAVPITLRPADQHVHGQGKKRPGASNGGSPTPATPACWPTGCRSAHEALSAGDEAPPTRSLRPRSEKKKMASPMPIDATVIAPTARAHPDLVKMGAHGAQNSSTTAAASAMTPTTPHRASTPHGVRWTALNFSGNERRTKNTSLKRSTIDVHHTTVTAASSTR